MTASTIDATSTTWHTGSSRRTVFGFCRYCLRHDVWEVYWYIGIHNNFSSFRHPNNLYRSEHFMQSLSPSCFSPSQHELIDSELMHETAVRLNNLAPRHYMLEGVVQRHPPVCHEECDSETRTSAHAPHAVHHNLPAVCQRALDPFGDRVEMAKDFGASFVLDGNTDVLKILRVVWTPILEHRDDVSDPELADDSCRSGGVHVCDEEAGDDLAVLRGEIVHGVLLCAGGAQGSSLEVIIVDREGTDHRYDAVGPRG